MLAPVVPVQGMIARERSPMVARRLPPWLCGLLGRGFDSLWQRLVFDSIIKRCAGGRCRGAFGRFPGSGLGLLWCRLQFAGSLAWRVTNGCGATTVCFLRDWFRCFLRRLRFGWDGDWRVRNSHRASLGRLLGSWFVRNGGRHLCNSRGVTLGRSL